VLVANIRFQSPEQAHVLFSHILGLLASTKSIEITKTLVASLTGLTRSCQQFIGRYVDNIYVVISGILKGGEEEGVEAALVLLESLVCRCPGMGKYAQDIERIGTEWLTVEHSK
jgi:hypothetical protein